MGLVEARCWVSESLDDGGNDGIAGMLLLLACGYLLPPA